MFHSIPAITVSFSEVWVVEFRQGCLQDQSQQSLE